MVVSRTLCGSAVAVLALALAACGDPDSTDGRGYTKAPLENPSVVIRGENPSDVSRYGTPNRVVAEAIELPEAAPAAAGGAAGGADPLAGVQLPEGVTAEMVAAGGTVFGGAGTCNTCHGANGTGTPLAPALNDTGWLNIDGSFESIVGVITNGVPTPKQAMIPMMPRGGSSISDEQVRQVAAYVYAISHAGQ